MLRGVPSHTDRTKTETWVITRERLLTGRGGFTIVLTVFLWSSWARGFLLRHLVFNIVPDIIVRGASMMLLLVLFVLVVNYIVLGGVFKVDFIVIVLAVKFDFLFADLLCVRAVIRIGNLVEAVIGRVSINVDMSSLWSLLQEQAPNFPEAFSFSSAFDEEFQSLGWTELSEDINEERL